MKISTSVLITMIWFLAGCQTTQPNQLPQRSQDGTLAVGVIGIHPGRSPSERAAVAFFVKLENGQVPKNATLISSEITRDAESYRVSYLLNAEPGEYIVVGFHNKRVTYILDEASAMKTLFKIEKGKLAKFGIVDLRVPMNPKPEEFQERLGAQTNSDILFPSGPLDFLRVWFLFQTVTMRSSLWEIDQSRLAMSNLGIFARQHLSGTVSDSLVTEDGPVTAEPAK